MSDYIDELKRDGDFDQVRAKVLSGEIKLCPNCWGEGETMEWHIDTDFDAVVYEYPPCPLCAPEPVRAPVAVTDEEIPL